MVDEAEDFGRIGDRCACGGAVMHARDKGAGQRSLAGRVEGPGEGLGRDRDATEGGGP